MVRQVLTDSQEMFNLNLRVLDSGNVSPAQAAAHAAASWGIEIPMLNAPGKKSFEGRDHSDWYEQRSKDVAKFRCEVNGGTPIFW